MGDDRARDRGDEQAVFLEVNEALGLGAWEIAFGLAYWRLKGVDNGILHDYNDDEFDDIS